MKSASAQRFIKPFSFLIIAIGAAVSLISAYHLPVTQLDGRFLMLAVITTFIGSRLGVKIPGTKGEITVSDTFIFLTMLLFGGEAAVLLAGVEAFSTSFRFTKRKALIIFNAAVMACSTFLTVKVINLFFGSITQLSSGVYSNAFITAICLMAFVQYVVNSGIVATAAALKTGQPIWHTWKSNYLWTSITYFAGASAAAIIAKLIVVAGFYAVIAATPIIAVVYFTYWTYLKNVEAKSAQIEQAERHIAEQERISRALRESEEYFRKAFDYAAIGMALVDTDGRWLRVNRSLCGIVGYSEQELLATNFQSITKQDDLDTALRHLSQLLKDEILTYQIEKRYLHKLGHEVWVLLNASLIRDAELNSSRFIFQIQDITDRKRAEGQLLHDAFHDALTGLPNRALFIDHLKLALERAKRREDRRFAVLFLDLDRFKIINDSLGHMIGDQLLVGIARRLEECLRPGDTVARLGGDEFTILLEDIQNPNEATEVAERIQTELAKPFSLNRHEVFTTASIGIAPSTIGYEQPEDVLRDADTAMYHAKSLGKARHEMFDRAMHSSALSLLQVETDLRRAIERREFTIHYQPIVSLEDGRLCGFEALVRWQHPVRGLISPATFIPVAEETGMIIPIGQWVLGEACRQMREWHQESPELPPLSISVNLSGKQFMQPDLIRQITQTLQVTGLDPCSLKLEITESIVMQNTESAVEMLKQLRSLGVQLSIDDFGTGYSSLSYLHRFPMNTLKIDRSFVTRMADNNENTEIVRTIVMLARNLGMDVIAEGVETEGQLAQLRTLDCKYGQGYYFSKPVNKDAAKALIEEARNQMEMLCIAKAEPLEGFELLGSTLLM